LFAAGFEVRKLTSLHQFSSLQFWVCDITAAESGTGGKGFGLLFSWFS
jgi:hypothetical protein